jgi:predicted peroxiredoxin
MPKGAKHGRAGKRPGCIHHSRRRGRTVSLAFTLANGGITTGLKVSIFLLSNGVDLVRKRAADLTQAHPCEPLASLIKDFLARGGRLWACVLCVKARGYTEADLLDGVVISGASVVHELIKTGAATISL